MHRYVVLGSLLLLIACQRTTGTKIDESQLATIHKGTTTYADVIKNLGTPTQTTIDSAGNRTITYVYRHESFDAGDLATAIFTPLGKENDHVVSIVVVFDQNNVVKDYASSTVDKRH